MRKLVSPHLAGSWTQKLDILRQWQPPLCLVLQPEFEKVKQLRETCPKTIIIGRFYHEDSWYAHNISIRPKEFAQEIHNEIVTNPVTPLLDYVQSNNETNQDWQGIQQLNVYGEEWMHLADQSGAYKCAIHAFSVGNPDMPYKPGDPAGFDGRMLYWQQVLPSLNYAQRNDHLLLLHAYGYPDLFHPSADWYIYRYERQVQDNLKTLGITNLKYAYGELGIDRLIVGEKGGYKSVPTSDQDYVNQLLQWERDLQGESLLLGGAIFTFGDSGGWGSYDITTTDAAEMIAAHYSDYAEDYVPANNKDSTVFIPAVGTGEKSLPIPIGKGKILAILLNVRDRADTTGKVIGSRKQDDLVTVYTEHDGWYQIGQNEWVAKNWVETIFEGNDPKDNWQRSRNFVRKWEGEFQDLDWDAGNWTGCEVGKGEKKGTKYGVSACAYPNLDIKNLTLDQADRIHYQDRWIASGADKLEWPICLLVYNVAVNFTPTTAKKWLVESGGDPLHYVGLYLRGYRNSTAWPQARDAWVSRAIDVVLEAVK